uniref:LisH domain-containing protein n=1 Tax=Rhabditophanes sp. KR3021 TaxID=114890 RepID=A0AC35UI69_9BILA
MDSTESTSTTSTMSPSEEKLMFCIYGYLIHKNHSATALSFKNEVIFPYIRHLSRPLPEFENPNFLLMWWELFWNCYNNSPTIEVLKKESANKDLYTQLLSAREGIIKESFNNNQGYSKSLEETINGNMSYPERNFGVVGNEKIPNNLHRSLIPNNCHFLNVPSQNIYNIANSPYNSMYPRLSPNLCKLSNQSLPGINKPQYLRKQSNVSDSSGYGKSPSGELLSYQRRPSNLSEVANSTKNVQVSNNDVNLAGSVHAAEQDSKTSIPSSMMANFNSPSTNNHPIYFYPSRSISFETDRSIICEAERNTAFSRHILKPYSAAARRIANKPVRNIGAVVTNKQNFVKKDLPIDSVRSFTVSGFNNII